MIFTSLPRFCIGPGLGLAMTLEGENKLQKKTAINL